jgi:hypothetical protein
VACDHARFYGSYEKAHAEWKARQQQRGQQQPQGQPQPQRPGAAAAALPPGAPPSSQSQDREPTRWWEDREHVQRRREELLVAERAVLFALNFAVATAHPYASLLRWVAELDWRHAARAWRRKKRQRQEEEEKEGQEKEGQIVVGRSAAAGGGGGGGAEDADDGGGGGEEEEKRLAAALSRDVLHVAWNIVTDSARTQLGIMHPPSKIAAGALYMAAATQGTLPLPPLLKPLQEQPGGGALAVAASEDEENEGAFFRRYRLTSDELDAISMGMMDANEELTSKGRPLLCLELGGTTGGGGEGEGGEAAADSGKRRRLLVEGAPAPLLLSNG